MAEADLMVTPV